MIITEIIVVAIMETMVGITTEGTALALIQGIA